MVDQRVEDLYEFNIQGNFDKKLNELTRALQDAQAQWDQLRETFASTATFAKPKKEIKKLSGEAKEAAESVAKLVKEERELASASIILGRAYNQLANESNKLNTSRAAEAIALEQIARKAQPAIINARAEERAIRRLSGELVKIAADRKFAQLAAEQGLKVSADGKRLFDAEAIAAKKAAVAQEKLAVSRALAAKGLTATGAPKVGEVQGPPLPESIRRQFAAEKQFSKDLERARIDKVTNELKAQNTEWQELTRQTERARGSLKPLEEQTKKTDSTFNRISFTFRRLIGIMAAFTVARLVVNEFNSMIATAIQFNAQIERNRVGIAGLIAAAAEVRAPDGSRIGLDDQLLRSQDIAIDQMKKLRREALLTAASYDELADAFSTAVAPGLQSGLNLDQIRQITVSISQAATGLGLAQNQLAEEIRSLFQGTITPRNTRVAVALGISNADINRAKELGQLFQFLENRFKAISKTGVKLMETFTAQMSNASDAFKQLLAEASGPLFEQLKGAAKQFTDIVANTADDAPELIRPEAVSVLQGLFKGLAEGVQGIRNAFAQIDAQGLKDTFSALGQSLGLVGTALATSLTTAFNLASPLIGVFAGIIEAVNNVIQAVSGWDNGITRIFQRYGQILVLVIGIRFALTKIIALGRIIQAQWIAIRTAMAIYHGTTILNAVSLTKIQKLTLLISANFKKILVPVLLATAAIVTLDTVLGALGIKFRVFDILSESFSFLNDQLDRLLVGSKGLSESATQASAAGLGIVTNNFAELKSELDDLSLTLQKDLRGALSELGTVSRTLGLDSDFVQQIEAAAQAQLEFTENTRKQTSQISQIRTQLRGYADEEQVFAGFVDKTSASLVAQKKTIEEAIKSRDTLDAAFKKNQFAEFGDERTRIALFEKLQQLNREIPDLLKRQNELSQDIAFQTGKRNTALAQVRAKTAEIESLTLSLQDSERELLSLQDARLQKLSEIARFNLEQKQVSFDSDFKTAEASLLAASRANDLQSETLAAQARFNQNEAERLQRRRSLTGAIAEIEEQLRVRIEKSNQEGFAVNQELLDSYNKQIEAIKTQQQQEEALFAVKSRQLELERRLAQLREKGSSIQGTRFGLQQFAQENASTFNIGEKFGQDLANNISSFGATAFSEAVASAFDPNRNFNLREAAGSLLFSLGQGLLEDVFKNVLSRLITDLGIGIALDSGGAAGAAAIQTAAATQSAETVLGGATLAAGALLDGSIAAGGVLETSAGVVALAIVGAAEKAALLLSGASIAAGGGVVGGATGGLSTSLGGRHADLRKTHRGAQGFSRGGRPRHIDRRDTIPAFLRPEEWVIRPEAVRKYGHRHFDDLNSMRLNPKALRGLSGPGPVLRDAKPKRSFATGGPVRSSQAASGGFSGGPVIQFFDEQVMDRALAAGSNAAVRFARRRRGSYRAALGLEPGS